MATALNLLRWLVASAAALVAGLLTLPVLLVGAPFWGVAALTAAIHRRVARLSSTPEVVPWPQLIRFEPAVGWRPRARLDVYAKGDVVFHLTTDDDGWRGKTTIDAAEIVVFGDSFAFGMGVDDSAFFADRLARPRMKAIGTNGYSMAAELIWMERLADRLAGKLVAWFIYYGNDLYDNLQPNLGHYRMPFVRTIPDAPGRWELVTRHIRPEPWPIRGRPRYLTLLAEICTPGDLSERAFAACEYLIDRGRTVCDEVAASLVVIGIPDPSQLDTAEAARLAARLPDPRTFDPVLPDRRLERICLGLGVPFVTLRDHLTRADYKSGDCHWNVAGHGRVARVLATLYERHSPVGTRTDGPVTLPIASGR